MRDVSRVGICRVECILRWIVLICVKGEVRFNKLVSRERREGSGFRIQCHTECGVRSAEWGMRADGNRLEFWHFDLRPGVPHRADKIRGFCLGSRVAGAENVEGHWNAG